MNCLLGWTEGHPGVAAWVQAIGSVFAILVAVWIPARQRSQSLQDAKADRALRENEHLKRLSAGLRVEINAAREAADRMQATITKTLNDLQKAREGGATIMEVGPIQPGSMVTTDAIVYRQIAAELGRLPPDLIRSVVIFYTLTLELGRLADGASSAYQAYKLIQPLLPRLRMHAMLVIRTLDKFEASGFSLTAAIRPTPDEVKQFAAEVATRSTR